MFTKSQPNIGLDFGSSIFKLVKVKKVKQAIQLVDFYCGSIIPNIAENLKAASQAHDAKFVNISVSGPATIIRYVNFPRMSQDELKKAIKFEAQKYIPFSVADVNLDVAILKQDASDNKMLICLAAVKKDFLTQRIKLLQESGFKINFIDLDSLALINAFNFNYPYNPDSNLKTIALLNIGSNFSNLNILEAGIPSLSRDINIAGKNITQKISDTLGIDLVAAEALKVNPDKERIVELNRAIEPVVSGLANEIRVSFDYYESQSLTSVSKIFLSGGASLSLGLKDALANILGIEVEFWDTFKKIEIAGNLDAGKIKSLSSQLAVTLGLALRF